MTSQSKNSRTVADMYRMLDSAERIVARGEDAFTDEGDDTQFLAGKALIIDMQSAADRLTPEFRESHSELPWRELKRTRDKLGHHYLDVNKVVIFRVLANEFPKFRQHLARDPCTG